MQGKRRTYTGRGQKRCTVERSQMRAGKVYCHTLIKNKLVVYEMCRRAVCQTDIFPGKSWLCILPWRKRKLFPLRCCLFLLSENPNLKYVSLQGTGPSFGSWYLHIYIVSHHSSREHRAVTKFRHLTRFLASTLTSFHVLLWCLISSRIVLRCLYVPASNSCPCFQTKGRRHGVHPVILSESFFFRQLVLSYLKTFCHIVKVRHCHDKIPLPDPVVN